MNEQPSSNLWSFLEILTRRRGLIIGLVVLATAVSVVVALLLPQWYKASALLFPPPAEPGGGGLAQLAQVRAFTGETRLPGMITQNDVYARMLKSHTMSDRIIERFDLKKRFSGAGRTALYEWLGEHTDIRVTDEGLLSLSVEDRTAQSAADIATAYVEELIELNRDLRSEAASEKRGFIEARLEETKNRLDSTREELKQFQVDNHAVDFNEQTRLAIDQAIGLKVNEADLEFEVQVARQALTDDNPELIDLENQLRVVKEQLRQLETGQDSSSFLSLPIASIPGLRSQYEALTGRLEVDEALYETLYELYEQARIQEKESTPTIAVLDWPTVPDLRSRPQRSVIVLGTFVCSLIVALLLAAVLEYVGRMRQRQPDDYRRLMSFSAAFFGWLPGVKKAARRRS